jgi:hypothetical protein
VVALVQPVQRQVQSGHRAQHLVVRLVAEQRYEQRGPVPAPSSTSITSTPVAPVIDEIRSARSSRPASIATSVSQIRSTSPSRWEQTTMEIPNSVPIREISSSIASRPAGSSPLVGSSSSSRSGSCTSAWASFTRCFMPVE